MQRLLPLPLKVTANSQTYRWKWAVTPTVRVLCNGAQDFNNYFNGKMGYKSKDFFFSTLQPPLQIGYFNIAQDVRDVLINPPAMDPYTTLKQKLISHMTELEQRRVQMLLTEEELGDRKTISVSKAHGATRGWTTTRQSHTQTVVLTASATKCMLNSCFKKRFPVIVGSRWISG